MGTTFHILNKENNTTTGDEYVFYIASNTLHFAVCDQNFIADRQGRKTTTLTASEIDNVWCHVVATYDGRGGSAASDGINIYVNGVNKTSLTFNAGSYTAMHNTTSNVKIGSYSSGVFADGNIDETAIFSSELTSANVTSIYNSGVPNDLTSLNPTAWYRNGDNGSYKSPQWLIPNNSNKDKVSNYSFSYDGVDDYIDLGFINFDATNGLTMSCWIKYDGVGAGLNWLCSNGNTGGVSTQFNTRLSATGFWFNYFLGSARYTGIGGLNDGNWHHIAQTVNYSNGDVKFYKDGVVSATIYTYGSTYSTAIVKEISSSFFPFKGQIDEFAVFESIENIADLYNGGVPSDLSSLSPVGYWRSENSTFSTNWIVTDNGSGGNNGTSANMTIEDRVGDAPNSTSNALSYNMTESDRETDVPS
jgi:hypothetical protein